ncbi:MAG TPA: TMEM175 family protein [Candidatus Limnocylindrales bacterium]
MPDRPSTLERLVFFSDAVFAIAITLLAIDLRLPPLRTPDGAGLLEALSESRGELYAFALSFFIVGTFWVAHVRTMHSIESTNGRLVGLNLVFLFFIALLPFPTSVLADHGDLPAGAITYALFMAATGLASVAVWVYATSVGLAAVEPAYARGFALRLLTTPAILAASIPLALVSPLAAELIWLLSFPASAVVSRRLGIDAAVRRALSSE